LGNEGGKLGRRGRGEEGRGFEESFRDSQSVAEERKRGKRRRAARAQGSRGSCTEVLTLCVCCWLSNEVLGENENI
jgi:hypothetical protein